MTLKITIIMDNAAFEGRSGDECARILRDAADKLDGRDMISGGTLFTLRDVNGNRVGEVQVAR